MLFKTPITTTLISLYTVLQNGHIGHVRFLLSLKASEGTSFTPISKPAKALAPMPEDDMNNINENTVTQEPADSLTNASTSPWEAVPRRLQVDKSDPPSRDRKADQSPRPLDKQSKSWNAINDSLLESDRLVTSPSSSTPRSQSTDKATRQPQSPPPCHRQYNLGVRRASVSPCTTIATQMKVISGGDGLEMFLPSEVSTAGESPVDVRQRGDLDGESHLLIWDVH